MWHPTANAPLDNPVDIVDSPKFLAFYARVRLICYPKLTAFEPKERLEVKKPLHIPVLSAGSCPF
jgi:hypothetical protein